MRKTSLVRLTIGAATRKPGFGGRLSDAFIGQMRFASHD